MQSNKVKREAAVDLSAAQRYFPLELQKVSGMTDQEDHERAGTMSVRDMQGWLHEEIRDSAKAHELRVKDATDLVTAYAEGKLTPQQALEQLIQFDRRWGEALYGTSAFSGLSDQEILDKIDAARSDFLKRPSESFVDRAAAVVSRRR